VDRWVCAEGETLALAGVDFGIAGPAEQVDCCSRHWPVPIEVGEKEGGIIRVVGHWGGGCAVRQGGCVELSRGGEVSKVGCEGLQLQHPQDGGEGAALLKAIGDREGVRQVAIDPDSYLPVCREQAEPPLHVGPEVHRLCHLVDPRAVDTVVRLFHIQEEQGCRLVGELQPLRQGLVEDDVLPDPAACEEGCLQRVNQEG
jgi:hypothetical protein